MALAPRGMALALTLVVVATSSCCEGTHATCRPALLAIAATGAATCATGACRHTTACIPALYTRAAPSPLASSASHEGNKHHAMAQ
ncbi:hypothetical protein HaLaN_16032 [Haematococcus lacustris]|uniref:Uncharacterized protein n=1 Tax=Haematococcus lacustris TaxID=44745 RepID=A0A699ZAE6_HAELA|nr:hypothetical protein HaLaN_16032 [Haematococcus lacustris]